MSDAIDLQTWIEGKAQGFNFVLGELCVVAGHIHNNMQYAWQRQDIEGHAALSLQQLQLTFGISRISALTALYSHCQHDAKLAKKTWQNIQPS